MLHLRHNPKIVIPAKAGIHAALTPDPPHQKTPTGFAIAASRPAWNWSESRLDPSFRWGDE